MFENEAVAELQQPQLVTGFINLFYCVTPKELLQAANCKSQLLAKTVLCFHRKIRYDLSV